MCGARRFMPGEMALNNVLAVSRRMASTTPFSIGKPATRAGRPFALYALWFFLLMAVARLGEIIPPLGAIPLAKITVVACIFGLFLIRRELPQRPLLAAPVLRVGAWLLLLCVLSIPLSIAWKQSTATLLTSVAVVATGAVLTIKLVSDRQRLLETLYVFVLIGMIQAVAAVATGTGRISAGESYDPNDLAYLLVTVMPLCAAFVSRSRTTLWRGINAGMLLLMLAAVLLTQSRGGLLGLGAALAYLTFAKRHEQAARPRVRKKGPGIFARLLLLSLGVAMAWQFMPAETRERLATLVSLQNDYNTDTSLEGGRIAIWTRNSKAALRRPIGYGLGTFERVDASLGGRWRTAHNSPLLILVELGFVGCVLFLAAHVVAFRSLATPHPGDPEAAIFCRALRASILANFVAGFFLSQSYSCALWTLLVLCGISHTMLTAPALGRRRARSPGGAHAVP